MSGSHTTPEHVACAALCLLPVNLPMIMAVCDVPEGAVRRWKKSQRVPKVFWASVERVLGPECWRIVENAYAHTSPIPATVNRRHAGSDGSWAALPAFHRITWGAIWGDEPVPSYPGVRVSHFGAR